MDNNNETNDSCKLTNAQVANLFNEMAEHGIRYKPMATNNNVMGVEPQPQPQIKEPGTDGKSVYYIYCRNKDAESIIKELANLNVDECDIIRDATPDIINVRLTKLQYNSLDMHK